MQQLDLWLVGCSKMRSKYGVDNSAAGKLRRTYEHVIYDSQAEMEYAAQLHMRLKAGYLHSVERQVRMPLMVNGSKVCDMVIDFRLQWPDGKTELHDVKGMVTPVWRLKAKLFEAIYGYKIIEVYKGAPKYEKAKANRG